ncbi:MAG: carbohydrate kinase [Bacteroidales bacterium]|jgi:xylulokinase|nr:carbohydrate kinase [Bacteroidales bacterium]
MILLGIDVGSSSVKLSLLDAGSGKNVASAQYPKQEMKIISHKPEWAEQNPEDWWHNILYALRELSQTDTVDLSLIQAIGITYQMHGLVCVDKNHEVIRPSIIWCDSRAVEIGNKAFNDLGHEICLSRLLNSPGNFTASKIKWVKDNEPELYKRIHKIMLPGDYIAMRLTGEINTTVTGLSEGIFWDFPNNRIADFLLDYYGIQKELLPDIVPAFGIQGKLSNDVAKQLGLKSGIPISYRAGDQPNNAFSLNVLHPGEIAATAGTSGVVYGVTDQFAYDPESRVNIFAHVNHNDPNSRMGVLLCINGTGILNSWIHKNVAGSKLSYAEMNEEASQVGIGSEGLSVIPFGNGAERVIENRNTGCQINYLNFNIHNASHLFRAAQEGIAFSFKYGMDIMAKHTGLEVSRIRAGHTNMFLSSIFRDTLSGITGVPVDLYDTDGSEGAARGAGVGSKIFASFEEAFANLVKLSSVEPDKNKIDTYKKAYANWYSSLEKLLN